MAADDAHGYDQTSRWGPDYDCSSLVISAWKRAGVPLTCTYTGNMKADMLAHGFRDVTKKIDLRTGSGLKAGDVLLHEAKHTALYLGGGQIVNAGGNEYGKATGGKTGDQTGREIAVVGYYNFPWEWVLRYDPSAGGDPSAGQSPAPPLAGEAGGASPAPTGTDTTYTVKSGDSLWGIAERVLGNGLLYEEIRKLNGLPDYWIYPGQVLKLPGDTSSDTPHQSPAATASPQGEATEELIVTLKKTVVEKMEKTAEREGITLSELMERTFQ